MSSMPKKSDKKSNSSQVIAVSVILGVALILSFGYVWWQFVRNDPKNTFQQMLANNLRTGSVTRTVSQDSGSQKVEQIVRLQNQTQHIVHGRTTLIQKKGNDTNTAVVTENVGTTDADYIRYIKIDTNQKNSKGGSLEFNKVVGIWGKNEPSNDVGLGDQFSENMLGLFLFADLTKAQREELLDIINTENVYATNYNSAKKTTENGRPYYNYRVSIEPRSYVVLLKKYSEIIGLKQMQGLNPDNYKGADPLVFNVKVDILTQRLATISALAAQRTETFNGYGIYEEVEIPTKTIDLPELQKRLNESTSA